MREKAAAHRDQNVEVRQLIDVDLLRNIAAEQA
jgi:hypothetical protein